MMTIPSSQKFKKKKLKLKIWTVDKLLTIRRHNVWSFRSKTTKSVLVSSKSGK